jgi:hypothetical protein
MPNLYTSPRGTALKEVAFSAPLKEAELIFSKALTLEWAWCNALRSVGGTSAVATSNVFCGSGLPVYPITNDSDMWQIGWAQRQSCATTVTGGGGYTYSGSIDSSTNVPTGSGQPAGQSSIWFYYELNPIIFCYDTGGLDTGTNNAANRTDTTSGTYDYASGIAALVNALVANPWPAWGTTYQITYDQYFGTQDALPVGGTYTGSQILTNFAGDGSPPNNIEGPISSPSVPGTGWCQRGTDGTGHSQLVQAFKGKVKVTANGPVYYWLGRFIGGPGIDGAMGVSGITKTKISFVSDGFIVPDATTGIGYLEIPGPGATGGSPNVMDYYWCVVGQEVNSWMAANGYSFGTTFT